MKQETDRITADANNWGFYHFVDSYISFEVDTVTKPGKLELQSYYQKKRKIALLTQGFILIIYMFILIRL